MAIVKVTVVPVGKVDVNDLEITLNKVSKVIRGPLELREPVQMPRGTEDNVRRQHDALRLLASLKPSLSRAKVHKTVGVEDDGKKMPQPSPDVVLFITDVDMFIQNTDAVMAKAGSTGNAAVISYRRMLEAFYRRPTSPKKQRARLMKEILRYIGHYKGLPQCRDASCAMSGSRNLQDIDRKAERYCAPCWKRMSSGTMSI